MKPSEIEERAKLLGAITRYDSQLGSSVWSAPTEVLRTIAAKCHRATGGVDVVDPIARETERLRKHGVPQ